MSKSKRAKPGLLKAWADSARATRVARAAELWRLADHTGRHPFKSHLLNFIAESAGLGEPQPHDIDWALDIPNPFSLIENPDESLAAIWKLVQAARAGRQRLKVDQSGCHTIDLCAATVLNVLALDAKLRLKTVFSGVYPANREALEIVAATGLPKALGIGVPKLDHFMPFELTHGGSKRESLLRSSRKEVAGQDLTDYVARVFAQKRFTFTREGRGRLGKLVGEVLGNAEDHANGREWWVCGYLRQPKALEYGDCHLTILNFGPTLAESLGSLPPCDLRTDIEQRVQSHLAGGSPFASATKLTEENIWTVLALQEGVSRHGGDVSGIPRGFGTADMIEAFQLLGRTTHDGVQPRMSLVSGQTHILFDNRYTMARHEMEHGQPRRIIAFNGSNDLYAPPDAAAVRTLTNRFPGVLLSLRFFVQKEYLQSIEAEYGTADS